MASFSRSSLKTFSLGKTASSIGKVAQTEARYVYEDAVEYFKEAIAKERRLTVENNISKIAKKINEDSVASVLNMVKF